MGQMERASGVNMAMTDQEMGLFISLFNRGGWVLDFTISTLDSFTMKSVGVQICARYKLSKGK